MEKNPQSMPFQKENKTPCLCFLNEGLKTQLALLFVVDLLK